VDTEDLDADDFEVGSNDIVDAIERVESAVATVESAMAKVEQAMKDKWSPVTIIGWLLIGAFLWNVPGEIWHAKRRYAMSYGVNSDNVIVADRTTPSLHGMRARLGLYFIYAGCRRFSPQIRHGASGIHQLQKDRGVRGVKPHFTHFKITSIASGTAKMASTTVNPMSHFVGPSNGRLS